MPHFTRHTSDCTTAHLTCRISGRGRGGGKETSKQDNNAYQIKRQQRQQQQKSQQNKTKTKKQTKWTGNKKNAVNFKTNTVRTRTTAARKTKTATATTRNKKVRKWGGKNLLSRLLFLLSILSLSTFLWRNLTRTASAAECESSLPTHVKKSQCVEKEKIFWSQDGLFFSLCWQSHSWMFSVLMIGSYLLLGYLKECFPSPPSSAQTLASGANVLEQGENISQNTFNMTLCM